MILRILLAKGPLTRAELEAEVLEGTPAGSKPIANSMIWKHLQEMEELDQVVCDTPKGQRHGRVTHWSTDADRVDKLIEIYSAWIKGGEDDPDALPDAQDDPFATTPGG